MAHARVVVGLDIGTTKVCTLIGEVKPSSPVEVVGVGVSPSRGLRKGLVVDMEEAAAAVLASLKKAEVFSGYKIIGAFVSVSGSHMETSPVHGSIALTGGRAVSRQDLAAVLTAARPVEESGGQRVLQVIPSGYTLDGENGIRNPVGMLGSHLEVNGVVVRCGDAPLQNVARCVERSGIQVDGFVPAGLASSHGVLSDAEKQLGVILMDLGGGTTDLAWYQEGDIRYVGALPVGGNHVTNDVSVGLGIPFSAAEEMKIRFASAVPANVTVEEVVDAGSFSDGQVRKVSRRYMSEIVEARICEIFNLAVEELEQRGFNGLLPAGVVLTGGGAQLGGIRELAQQMFNAPVRVGVPEGLAGTTDSISTPAYAAAAGLLKWVLAQADDVAGGRPMRRRVGLAARLKGLVRAFLP